MLSGEIYIAYENIFKVSAGLNQCVLHPDKHAASMFFVDKTRGACSSHCTERRSRERVGERERERGDRASGREQVKRSSVRNRPVEGDEQMAEKGRMATKVVRERRSYCDREMEKKKNIIPE